MRNVLIVFGICILLSAINDYLLRDEVNKIRQDIVEIKKDFSYDPKDAK